MGRRCDSSCGRLTHTRERAQTALISARTTKFFFAQGHYVCADMSAHACLNEGKKRARRASPAEADCVISDWG
jgi:hypothetical protein